MSLSVRQTPIVALCHLLIQRRCRRLDMKLFERYLCSKTLPDTAGIQNPHSMKYINNKIAEIFDYYEQFSGLKEVREAQEKVVLAGETLAKFQESRREAAQAVSKIQHKLNELHNALDNTKRGDSRYIQLITEEHNLLKEEETQKEILKHCEKAERDQFNILISAVNNSHEKERTQAKKTKYWSIIGSILGTIIGIIGTSITNHLRMSQIQKLFQESSAADLKEELKMLVAKSEKMMENDANHNNVDNIELNKSIENMLEKLDKRLINVEECVEKMNNPNSNGNVNIHLDPDNKESELLALHLSTMFESVQSENEKLRILVISTAILYLAVPIISKVFFS